MHLVSIIMPCFNSELYITEAINSIQSQTYQNWELIIVDDGCSDRSMQYAHQTYPQATIVKNPRKGISSALNQGIARAQGDYLAWIDADDLWLPKKLTKQVDQLRQHPQWAGCFGITQQFSVNGPLQLPSGPHKGSLLLRITAFNKIGSFREDIAVGEFIDWYARASDQGLVFGQLPEIVYHRRIHTNNTMRKNPNQNKDYLKILKSAIDRHRLQDI